MNKAVVTGIGLVTPLGLGREKTWAGVVGGMSGILDHEYTFLTARVRGIDVPDEARLLAMAFLAAAEAVSDSSIDFNTLADTSRFGCAVSVSKPNLVYNTDAALYMPDIFGQSTLAGQLARAFKLKGPVRNITAACATGTNSIILGSQWIEQGLCDIVFCGASETPFHPLYIAGFERMGVLARSVARPFDKNREGFALGEGAGVLILENKDTALSRGARIYGDIEGWALSNDTANPISFTEGGEIIAKAIERAVERAKFSSLDYINAHGTGTRLNDARETAAIKKAFGEKASAIAVSSTKAATGHLLGASGAVELAFCFLALRDQVLPPTLNLTTPDPECGLDYVPRHARPGHYKNALSLSFGFGGQIGVIAVSGGEKGYR